MRSLARSFRTSALAFYVLLNLMLIIPRCCFACSELDLTISGGELALKSSNDDRKLLNLTTRFSLFELLKV